MSLRSFTLSLMMVLLVFGSVNAAVVVPPVKSATTPSSTEAAALEAARTYRESLKEMSGKERRALKRQQIKDVKAAMEDNKDADTNTILLVILAILLPPVAVLVYEGGITNRFWIALLLTLLFYIPGLIYALLVIFGNA